MCVCVLKWICLWAVFHLCSILNTSLQPPVHTHSVCYTPQVLASEAALKELYSRAQGEVSIREALRELDKWGEVATFAFADYTVCKGWGLLGVPCVGCTWKDIEGRKWREFPKGGLLL